MTELPKRRLATSRTSLGAAVRCTDAVTNRPTWTGVTVVWNERDTRFQRTPSGHFVVTDLPNEVTELTIDVRAPNRYLDVEKVLDEVGTVANPLDSDYDPTEIRLYPSPSYPFGREATLLRGSVEADGKPVANAECWIETSEADTMPSFTADGCSDNRGEYVIAVRGIGAEDVTNEYDDGTTVAGRNLVHVDGERPSVHVKHPKTGEIVERTVVLPEGDTITVDVSL